MKQPIITLTPKYNQPGLFELCISVYADEMTRLEHEDFTLTVDNLWELKHQVDRALLEHGVQAGRISLT